VRRSSIGVSAGHLAIMPSLTLQQTLRALPNHRKRLFLRGLQARRSREHEPSHRVSCRAANRDPPVGIGTPCTRRVVSTRREGLGSGSVTAWPVFRANSLRPIATLTGHRHWPGPSPARVRTGSFGPFKLKLEQQGRASGSGTRRRGGFSVCPLSGHCRTSPWKDFS
jgi:hypothetical protein